MSVVSILGVQVLNNPAQFNSPYQFEITFECLEALKNDLEWKLTYVGSATSSEYDQELDSLLVGPVPVGINKFVFETEAPDLSRIPNSEILGVTVILLSCSYESREFVRVGYYVNNEYTDEALIAEPPSKPIMEKVQRSILAEKPRVTRFAIKWDSEESAPAEFPPEQPEADGAEDDAEQYGAEEEEEEEVAEEAEGEPAEKGEDAEMGGVEESAAAAAAAAAKKDDDAASDAGSEDLEAESEDDEEDEEEVEVEGEDEAEDDDMDMGEDGDKSGAMKQDAAAKHQMQQPADVMVH